MIRSPAFEALPENLTFELVGLGRVPVKTPRVGYAPRVDQAKPWLSGMMRRIGTKRKLQAFRPELDPPHRYHVQWDLSERLRI